MTVASTTQKAVYDGNGVAESFPTTFVFLDQEHVQCLLVDGNGLETALTLNTDYTVAGGNGATGAVIFPKAGSGYATLAAGEQLVIHRSVPLTQALDLVNYTDFDVELIERQLDLLTMVAQQQDEEIGRSIKVSLGSGHDPDAIMDSLATAEATAVASASTATSAAAIASAAQLAAETARDEAQSAVNGVEVSLNDTTPGKLEQKLASNGALSWTVNNPGGYETIAPVLNLDPASLEISGSALSVVNSALNKRYTHQSTDFTANEGLHIVSGGVTATLEAAPLDGAQYAFRPDNENPWDASAFTVSGGGRQIVPQYGASNASFGFNLTIPGILCVYVSNAGKFMLYEL